MRRLLRLNSYMLVAPGVRIVSLALIACAASITLVAQTESLPADPVPAAAASISAPVLGAPPARFGVATPDFGQSGFQPFALREGAGDNSSKWNRSMLDPFQPGPNFGNFSGTTDKSSRLGAASFGGRRNRFGSVFQTDPSNQHDLTGGEKGMHSASSIGLPSFNTLMRGNRNQPFSLSPGAFKLSNPDPLRLRGDTVDFTHPPGSATLINSDLGNGVLFSAGTGIGGRAAGAPAASLGNGTPGTKHSGAAVDLKLSF
jgi:hypothetical protein